jgi:hypothetical protein
MRCQHRLTILAAKICLYLLNFWVLVLRIRKHTPEVGPYLCRWRNVPVCTKIAVRLWEEQEEEEEQEDE